MEIAQEGPRPVKARDGLRVLVVGGAGYLGRTIVDDLLGHGFAPSVFDITACENTAVPSYVGDMTSIEAVRAVFTVAQPAACIHLASRGMSGSAMLSPELLRVNPEGARNVIVAAQEVDCHLVVYLSTYNVRYGGAPIVGGDEISTPLFDPARHCDYYSQSKAWAEAVIRAGHGAPCRGGGQLRTCVLRPAAIYGPGEVRHFPRIAAHMESGLFSWCLIGSPTALVDWVHVANVAQACRLAVAVYMKGPDPPTAPVYFISDGSPMNSFDFLRPLAAALGTPFPRLILPLPAAILVARIGELLYHVFGIEPLLTRAEVFKVASTHYFSIAAAQRDLGYRPAFSSIEGARQIAEHYGASTTPVHFFRYSLLHMPVVSIAATIGMATFAYLAFEDVSLLQPFAWTSPLAVLRAVGYAVFRTQQAMRWGFALAVGAHAAEAVYTVHVARNMGCALWRRWGLQTLWVGYPSLKLLLAHRARLARKKVQ